MDDWRALWSFYNLCMENNIRHPSHINVVIDGVGLVEHCVKISAPSSYGLRVKVFVENPGDM